MLTDEQLGEAQDLVALDGTPLLDALAQMQFVAEDEVLHILGAEYGMDVFDFTNVQVSTEVIAAVPKEIARRYEVIPVSRSEGTLTVAMADPTDLDALDAVRYILKCDVDGVVASRKQVQHALGFYYGDMDDSVESFLEDMTEGTLDITDVSTTDVTTETSAEEDDDAPIIRLVSLLILEAFRTRTSDIHLEPLEKRFRVRYRIDGILHEVPDSPPKYLQNNVISRLKLMAGMDLSEHRIPQDGRIRIAAMGRELDLRVSNIPATHGESIVMRILDKSSVMLGISELGFFQDDQDMIMTIINFPDGIFLVTGPTGSGKTTSLYSFLHTLNQPTRKIITAEDPVEYELSGINQVQINADITFTFANALRSMLRQAPNIIMVGEIRDMETGDIAINAALTGHLVFSTLHTNDAPSAITRLMDMGIKPFLVASAVRAIMAQRLVRRICKNCAEPVEPTEQELDFLGLTREYFSESSLIKGTGCVECSKGYKGRMGIYEIFVLDDSIQNLIYQKADAGVIRERARELGMRSLRDDGLRKAASGVTTLEEVIRLTVSDDEEMADAAQGLD
ncbi:MAG: Flp pilus assembly complex ATPase component TadA [Victivallales bacterium]|nr:Flp pilus assembly complex ATPase component TadA [Victivallales bacterium]MBT7167013.1 Flp pilus assembly complex ATPase component TadA [Victivallales bacterium]MBT7302930.1 Flp pilus assembly complex ATPase component TadA [Victivallales bacterium]